MKERMRGFLGFLGLVEDEYGEYGPSTAPRPFSESVNDEPEWSPTPVVAPSPVRTFPAPSTPSAPLRSAMAPNGLRPVSNPNPAPQRPANPGVAARPVAAMSSDRDVVVVSPSAYDDSRRITDHVRANRAVVLLTQHVDQSLARRLVDFTAGTAYAMNARIEPLLKGVYLISPRGLYVGPEVKERLRTGDFASFERA